MGLKHVLAAFSAALGLSACEEPYKHFSFECENGTRSARVDGNTVGGFSLNLVNHDPENWENGSSNRYSGIERDTTKLQNTAQKYCNSGAEPKLSVEIYNPDTTYENTPYYQCKSGDRTRSAEVKIAASFQSENGSNVPYDFKLIRSDGHLSDSTFSAEDYKTAAKAFCETPHSVVETPKTPGM